MRKTDGGCNGFQSTRSLALLSAVVTPRITAELCLQTFQRSVH